MVLNTSTPQYTRGSVISADGTSIGYRQLGSGPALILLHGGMQASQHYMRLATALSDAFTVSVPDRRGRGMSGPQDEQYSLRKECEDVEALLSRTGAHFVFGHSAGALIGLQAALTLPAIHKLAVYEPPFPLHGSVPLSWVPRYEREVAQGDLASAMLTVFQGLQISQGIFGLLPRWLLLPLIRSMLRKEKRETSYPDVTLEELVPTIGFEQRLVKEMDQSLERFAGMHAKVLLLGGKKTAPYLLEALDALSRTLPGVKRIDYPDLGHNGPNTDAPERISKDLRAFFSKP